ncbi:HPF/RaiA family ribosome-associated protein [Patescibacteria group bacterium]|nr:HPF/RaiA family ribosome-associated protein [Patescibacteria group bacterium]
MKIIIKTKNIKLNRALKNYIQEKLNSLEKFAKIFQSKKEYFNHFFGKGRPRVEAWVEIGKETLHHQKGPYFWAECQMRFPNRSLRSTARAKNLKMAITRVKDELQRELKQYKGKIISKSKKKQRVLKKELKISPSARFYRKGRVKEEGI